MTFQYIINHLHEPHLWCIVLTAPHAELNIQKKLEQLRGEKRNVSICG